MIEVKFAQQWRTRSAGMGLAKGRVGVRPSPLPEAHAVLAETGILIEPRRTMLSSSQNQAR